MIARVDFYTKTELPIRVAFCWMVFCTCSIISNLLAVGILRMRGVLGRAGWRWLFLIEYVDISSLRYASHLLNRQGAAHIGYRHCDVLHDAALANPDKGLVSAKWVVC